MDSPWVLFNFIVSYTCASGRVVECRICNRKVQVAGSNLSLGYFSQGLYSAFHPSVVGKWVPAAAGKAKAGMAHSNCGWTCGCAGKTVKSLENTCHTWAPLRWWFTTKRRYIRCMHLYLLPFTCKMFCINYSTMVSYENSTGSARNPWTRKLRDWVFHKKPMRQATPQ